MELAHGAPQASPGARALPLARPRLALFVMLSSYVAQSVSIGALLPVVPALSKAFHGDEFLAQLLVVMPFLGLTLGGAASGPLLERLGVRNLIAAASVFYGLAGSSGLALESPALLLTAGFLVGLSTACLSTACGALIGESYDGEARAKVLGYGVALGGASTVASVYLAGALAQAIGWRAPFGLYGLVAVLVLVPALISVPRRRREAGAASAAANRASGSLLGLAPLYLLIIAVMITANMAGAQLALVLAADGVTAPAVRAVTLGMASLFTVIASLNYSRVQARVSQTTLVLGALSSGTAGVIVIGLTRGALACGFGAALIGIALGTLVPFFWSAVLRKASEAVRARAVGLLSSAIYLGSFCAPFAFAPLRAGFGLHGAFLALGVAAAVGVAIGAAVSVTRRAAPAAA